jgi:hypothetical protein
LNNSLQRVNPRDTWFAKHSLPGPPVVSPFIASAMNVDYSEEESIEDDWEDVGLIADAAGEIAEEAQQCLSQSGGLQNAYYNTINSIKLFGLSAFIKTASIEEQSGAISEMSDVIAQTLVRIDLRYTEHFRGS